MSAEDTHCAVLGIRSPSHYKAEIERLRAENERLDQCIGELRMELSKSQERNDELCVANHNQMVKLSKIRKVINEN